MNKVSKISVPALAFGVAIGSAGTTAYAETVKVESGDTLWEIAQANDVSVGKLKWLNSDVDPTALQIGTELQISSESGNQDGSSSREVFHTVEPGETLNSIANLHKNVTLDDLYEWNPNIDPYALQIGSEVRVSPPEDNNDNDNSGSREVFHQIEPGETLISIANLHKGVTLDELYKWNPGIDPYSLQVGSEIRVQPPEDNSGSREEFHTIEPGETLISIANLHKNVTLKDLYAWNPDIDPYNLQVGSEVRVSAP